MPTLISNARAWVSEIPANGSVLDRPQHVGSELAGQRAAIVMSLVQSARLNGHDPWAYLRDVLQRLPTQRSSQIED